MIIYVSLSTDPTLPRSDGIRAVETGQVRADEPPPQRLRTSAESNWNQK